MARRGSRVRFTFDASEIGTDDDGEPITSCVVRPDIEQAEAGGRLLCRNRAISELFGTHSESRCASR